MDGDQDADHFCKHQAFVQVASSSWPPTLGCPSLSCCGYVAAPARVDACTVLILR